MGHIVVSGVGKAYRRYRNRWARLVEWLDPDHRPRHERHWVLRDVGFSIAPGEAVGILGHNGAGKSTLLKIITGTTHPTQGHVEVGGRIAALLELGMGFHPEFTGRQNVFMAGQLLGFTAEQVAAAMPSITDFAEIGDYVDQPTRTYSSGMQMRLAFSVATSLRPDILIVDEALSVGDAYFQAKCIDRIRTFREQGTTLLFVSHSPGAVKSLCQRAILLDQGVVLRDGAADDVLDYYNAVVAKRHAHEEIRQAEERGAGMVTRSGSHDAVVERVELSVARTGEPARAVSIGESVVLSVDLRVNVDLDDLTVGVLIRDALGNDIFGTNTFHHARSLIAPRAGERHVAEFSIPSLELGQGSYTVSVALHTRDVHVTRNYDWWDRALAFQVVPGQRPFAIGVASMGVTVAFRSTAKTMKP